MIDRQYPDYTKIFRHAEIRVHGLAMENFQFKEAFSLPVTADKAWLYWLKKGKAWLITEQNKSAPQLIEAGTIVGVEGISHQWKSVDLASHSIGEDNNVEIYAGSIDKRAAILQRLPAGLISIPPKTPKYSAQIQTLLSMIEQHQAFRHADDGVCRKLSEVILILLINYARNISIRDDLLGEQLTHDEYILRAMSAFFMEPSKKWTVTLLANEAGISRAALFERFHRAFGGSPMKIINQVRLQLAAEMLVNTKAPLADVASEVGFGSAPAFVRAFVKQFSITPGQWRIQQ